MVLSTLIRRILVWILLIAQAAGCLLPLVAHAGFAEPGRDELRTGVLGISSVLAVVRTSIAEQMTRLVELACPGASPSGSESPAPQPAPRMFQDGIHAGLSLLSPAGAQPVFMGAALFTTAHRTAEDTCLLAFLWLFLFLSLFRIRRVRCVLPRGAIDHVRGYCGSLCPSDVGSDGFFVYGASECL